MLKSLSLKTLVTFAVFACLTVSSLANPFLNTLAWTRYVACGQVKLVVDSAGNTYMVYSKNDVNVGTDIDYIKYDPSGNAVSSGLLVYRADQLVDINGVYLSQPTPQTTYIYTTLTETDINTLVDSAVFTKCDLAGTQIWQSNYKATGFDYQTVGGFVDNSDNFWGALAVTTDSKTSLLMVETGPTGGSLQQQSTANIGPLRADFYNGKWCVVGNDETVADPTTSMRWGVYDPSDAHLITGALFDSLNNGTYTYTYMPLNNFYLDPAGAVDLSVNVRATRNSDSKIIGEKHFVRRYNLTGSMQWVSQSFDNFSQGITSSGSNGPIYVQLDAGFSNMSNQSALQSLDHLGNQSWITSPVPVHAQFYPVSDASGVFTILLDGANSSKIDLTRYDLNGNSVWTYNFAGGVLSQAYAFCSDAIDTKSNLYIACLYPQKDGSMLADIQRFVQGVALSALSASANSYKGGSIVPVKVLLNSPAPTGGVLVKLTSNSAKALFPNNTTSYSAAIPAGSLYAIVNVHTVAVATNTAVTVLGNQSGVQRAVAFTVTP
jgi:hypothetical protein